MARAEAAPGVPPAAHPVPELLLAQTAAVVAGAVVLPAAAIGGVLGGMAGAVGAGTGAGVVLLLALASLPLYRWAAAQGPHALAFAAYGGVLLRLVLGALAFLVASLVPGVSMPALGGGLLAALAATIVAEMRLASRDPRLTILDSHPNGLDRAQRETDILNAERT